MRNVPCLSVDRVTSDVVGRSENIVEKHICMLSTVVNSSTITSALWSVYNVNSFRNKEGKEADEEHKLIFRCTKVGLTSLNLLVHDGVHPLSGLLIVTFSQM